MKKAALIGFTSLSLLSFNVNALSVGEMKVNSFLGEALNVSIDLSALNKKEFSSLEVALASRDLFEQAGVTYPENADNLSFEIKNLKGGKAKINVRSRDGISTPFVHLLLQINWAGGNILREYAVLIDPPGYDQPKAVSSKALLPAGKLGVTKKTARTAVGSSNNSDSTYHGKVKSGDSLSAIAALYRPSDVSMQQAWMAFYALNRNAFPENNLNRIKRGASIYIPTREQMLSLSTSKAVREVRNLSQGSPAVAKRAKPISPASTSPTLTVGVSGASVQQAKQAGGSTKKPENLSSQSAANNAVDFGQMAPILSELENFKEIVKQELITTRDENDSFREALVAAKGENKVLSGRMEQLEAQLSRISRLLELQTLAMQEMTAGAVSADTPGSAQAALIENAAKEIEAAKIPETSQAQLSQTDAAGDLVAKAISAASEEDKSYLDAVTKDAATSVGLQDPNPVSAQAPAARNSPFMPEPDMTPEEQQTAMLGDVRAALGQLQTKVSPSGGAASGATSDIDLKLKTKDLDYISALNAQNQRDTAQLEESSKRIADLENTLKERVEEAKTNQQTIETINKQAAQDQVAASSEPNNVPRITGSSNEKTDWLAKAASLFGQAKTSVMNLFSGINTENMKYLGYAAAALLGLLALLGLRRRSENNEASEGSTAFFEDEMGSSMMVLDDEEALHGSSLFDMTDESFMASEIIQGDSSLFAMDGEDADDSMMVEMDSDSELLGEQSTMTQVVDVDPIAEAEVYLAYDRKEQAIKVLKDSLSSDPGQSKVVSKLLSLYQGTDNKAAFTALFESSAEHIEKDEDWNQIKSMAREFVPDHAIVQDDFEGSIPILTDAVQENINAVKDESDMLKEADLDLDLDLDSDSDLTPTLEDIISDDEPKKTAISLSDNIADELGEGESDFINLLESDDSSVILNDELDIAMKEVDQHDPETALALAKAYIELGEDDIAKDFLNDVVKADTGKFMKAAKKLLKNIG